MRAKDKYKWLLSKIKVSDVDMWEGDAVLRLTLAFQIVNKDNLDNLDFTIESIIEQEKAGEI